MKGFDKDKLKKKLPVIVPVFIMLFYIVFSTFITAVFMSSDEEKIQRVSYAEFLQELEKGNIDTVYYTAGEEMMTYSLYNDETRNMSQEELDEYEYSAKDKRETYYPGHEEFRKELLEAGVRIELSQSKSAFLSMLLDILPGILMIFILLSMLKSLSGQAGKLGDTILQTSNKKFSDIIGQDEVIEDIKFAVELLKNPDSGRDLGVHPPKGLLLIGPPGSGKTLIAKAIAGEAGVPFLSVAGSDFKELFVGNGAKRVRELFKLAREKAPCVVFIDELDSIGTSRASTFGQSEDNQTIAAMLKEMDGFKDRQGIFVIAATNYDSKIDEALIRAGRFDRQVYIYPPSRWTVRRDMFKLYLKDSKLSDDVNLDTLAKQCSGFTGADIEVVCNEAGIVAMMNGKSVIDTACIEEAMDKKIFKGSRSKEKSNEKDRQVVAYHEAGHAMVSMLLGEEIARVSIQASTGGVGGAVFGADKDSTLMSKSQLINRVKIAYGGRASEEIKFGDITSGASSDIQKATNLIDRYIRDLGFDEEFGLLTLPDTNSGASLAINERVLDRQIALSQKWYNEVVNQLKINYEMVETLAQRLLDCETLSGDEVKALFN